MSEEDDQGTAEDDPTDDIHDPGGGRPPDHVLQEEQTQLVEDPTTARVAGPVVGSVSARQEGTESRTQATRWQRQGRKSPSWPAGMTDLVEKIGSIRSQLRELVGSVREQGARLDALASAAHKVSAARQSGDSTGQSPSQKLGRGLSGVGTFSEKSTDLEQVSKRARTGQQSAEQAATGQRQRPLEQSVVEDRDTQQSAEQAAIGQGLKSNQQSAEQSVANGQGPVTAILPRADWSAEPVQPVSDSEDAVLEARSDLIFRGSHVVT